MTRFLDKFETIELVGVATDFLEIIFGFDFHAFQFEYNQQIPTKIVRLLASLEGIERDSI